ncbi:MAG: acetyl-CoA carboxylase biotin carboxyl carrier protein [Alphaproteobacteria bacterium]|nr:acetyl-CoA carboxylase biotin carboxyl carrier protein [Alphaproteobacteria bacterium]
MKIDPSTIKELAQLLEETGLNEIEVQDGDKSIRVSKGGGMIMAAPGLPAMAHSMHSDPTMPQSANLDAPHTIAHSHPGAVTSPMVGTAYTSPEPGAAAFVEKGDTVKAGDTLLIIEAMKVMNPIKAEKAGTVTHIMVNDTQPVEYGDVLMVIE